MLEKFAPTAPDFTGFIFKIQANMNPKHRDSVAFLRICSGRFERGMSFVHTQSGKTLRLLRPYKPFANEREILDEAFPGDVLGIPNNGDFAIGDSLCSGARSALRPFRAFNLNILPCCGIPIWVNKNNSRKVCFNWKVKAQFRCFTT